MWKVTCQLFSDFMAFSLLHSWPLCSIWRGWKKGSLKLFNLFIRFINIVNVNPFFLYVIFSWITEILFIYVCSERPELHFYLNNSSPKLFPFLSLLFDSLFIFLQFIEKVFCFYMKFVGRNSHRSEEKFSQPNQHLPRVEKVFTPFF